MTLATVQGLPVSPGIAIGEPVVHRSRHVAVLRVPIAEDRVDAEIERFRAALHTTVRAIETNQERARERMGEEYAAVFEAHKLIASDPSLVRRVEGSIAEQRVNAEWAFDQVVAEYLAQFEALEDNYLAERRLDLLDVANQILQVLHGADFTTLDRLDRPVVLVADDLSPSQVVQLPLQNVLGFILEAGGKTSHTTIIARSLGIPALVGATGACERAVDAHMAVLDAFDGTAAFDPDPAEIEEYESRRLEYEEQRAHLERITAKPSITRDRRRITLLANIDLPQEADEAVRWKTDGVGLYRSEFLYMQLAPAQPTEDDHLRTYRDLVERMQGRPVTIRTFDLGGKKLGREVIGNMQANPVLGLRGIRLCLRDRTFFARQLRPLLRVCGEYPEGRVKIMLPLISGLEEVRLTRLLIRELSVELRAEGHHVPHDIPIGIMVEVPSCAVMADRLARECDFFSIGTNDLIQYTLAVDRTNERVADLYRPSNPGVLRLISRVIESANDAGIPVSMCGETAADPLMVPVLIGLGLRRLSMSPQALPVIRNLVRHLSYRDAVDIANTAMNLDTARDVEEYLLERLAILFAKIKIHV